MAESERVKVTRWGIAATVGVGLMLVYWLRFVLLPFAIAAALAFVATPAIHQMQKRLKLPRWLAALILYVVFLGLVGLLFYWLEQVVVPQMIKMAEQAPQTITTFFQKALGSKTLSLFGKQLNPQEIANDIIGTAAAFFAAPSNAIPIVSTAFTTLIGFFMTLVLMLYFMLDGPRVSRGIFWLIPPDLRPAAREVGVKIYPVLLRYIAGVIIIVVYATALTYIGTGLILGIPHAILLSIAIGLLETIPVAGPIVSGIVLALVAVQQGTINLAIGLGAFGIALRLSIDQFVGPIVLGKAVTVHPVVIIFSFLVGGALFGILGVILAVPTAAVIKVVIQHAYNEYPERS